MDKAPKTKKSSVTEFQKAYYNNRRNSVINNYHKKLAKLFGGSIDNNIVERSKENPLKSYGHSEDEENSREPNKYAVYKTAPIGIDLIRLDYPLSRFEKLEKPLSHRASLLGGRIRIEGRHLPSPRISIQFNATALFDQSRCIPLSLSGYYENFKLVEAEIKKAILPDFSIWFCEISAIEVFKTVQMTHSPLDYYECLNVFGITAKYMKAGKHISESGRTFSLNNRQEEAIFYDKTAELTKKLIKKKHIVRALPDRMMRVEWKFTKGRLHEEKLMVHKCFDLFNKYGVMVGAYHRFFAKVLGEVTTQEDYTDFGTVAYFESLYKTKGKRRSKGQNRLAKDLALGRYLVEHGHLENFLRAKKGDKQQTKKINESMKHFIGHLSGQSGVRYIDLYHELKTALLSENEMVMPVV